MLKKFKMGLKEGLIVSISSFFAGIIINLLYIFKIVGEEVSIILLVISLINVIIITAKAIRLGFLFLIGWIIGVYLSYIVGLLNPISFLIFAIIPTIGFLIGIVTRIGILLIKIFFLIILAFIAIALVFLLIV